VDTNGKDDANDKPRTGRGLSVGSRPTQFQKGHRGRQLGSTNAVTRLLKDAVLMAAETSELSGGGKLVGYLRWASENEPKAFMALLSKLLPLQHSVDRFTQTVYRSYEQINLELGHHGLSLEVIEKIKSIDVSAPDVDEEK
jgi:hypothetical protein